MDLFQYLVVRGTFFKAGDLISVHFNEAILSQNVLKGILVEEERLNQFEEPLRIKFEEPFQKLVSSDKSDDIEDIHSPLEGCERSVRELFTLQEHPDNPHEFVSDISFTVLDIQLDFPLCLLLLLLELPLLHGLRIRNLVIQLVGFK